MKHILTTLLFAPVCLADPSQATLDALEVPTAVDLPVIQRKIAKKDFPAGLLAAMSQFGWGGNKGPVDGELDTRIPDEVDFQIVDLNSDGSPEYFANTYLGGTGGLNYLLFSKVGDSWKYIGESSHFKLLPKKNGWHPIVSFGRSGPYYFKAFYEFSEGSYRHVETHEILDGKVTKTKIDRSGADQPASAPVPKLESDSKLRKELVVRPQ